MKPSPSLFRWPAALLLFHFLSLPLFAAEPNTRMVRATELKAWIDYHETLESMSATFTQTRKLLTVKQPLTADGVMIFQAPDLFRWQLGEPPKTVVVHDGETVTVLDVDNKKAQVIKPSEDETSPGSYMTLAFPRNWEEFLETFDILKYEVEGETLTVRVMPKDEKLAEDVRWMSFLIDTVKNRIKEFSSSMNMGTSMVIEFHELSPNPEIEEGTFEVSLDGYVVER